MTRQSARPSQQAFWLWLLQLAIWFARGATSEGRAEAVMATARMVKRLVNCMVTVASWCLKSGRCVLFVGWSVELKLAADAGAGEEFEGLLRRARAPYIRISSPPSSSSRQRSSPSVWVSRLSAKLNLPESGCPFGCPRILGCARRSSASPFPILASRKCSVKRIQPSPVLPSETLTAEKRSERGHVLSRRGV